jgi:hypothetical protein
LALLVPLMSWWMTRKRKEKGFGFLCVYLRLLRMTATAAMTAMMTTAATAT